MIQFSYFSAFFELYGTVAYLLILSVGPTIEGLRVSLPGVGQQISIPGFPRPSAAQPWGQAERGGPSSLRCLHIHTARWARAGQGTENSNTARRVRSHVVSDLCPIHDTEQL